MSRLFTFVSVLLIVILASVSASAQDDPPNGEQPQIGLNFIRFFWEEGRQSDQLNRETPYLQPDWIFNDFRDLGIHTFRQFIKADLFWNVIEPKDDVWHFEAADAVLLQDSGFEPIVTLFALQYASPTPPWATAFQKTLGPEAIDYLEAVVTRYGDVVTYWEIGNEMDHWRIADPGAQVPPALADRVKMPLVVPADGFSPQEQGAFLAQVAAFIRERDPDAVILMPGMGGLDDYTLDTWFAGVIEGGGTDWFDIINYHYYGPWQPFGRQRQALDRFMDQQGIIGKPVWLTETGSTASPTLTLRTDYPNSPESQAADVFRRLVQAYGYGDSLAMWHTYIGSPDVPNNQWRLYGIRTDDASPQPAYYALRLFAMELIPFARVENSASASEHIALYRVTTAGGAVKYVVWGDGIYPVPAGVTQKTSVVPDAEGVYRWEPVGEGQEIVLSEVPILLK